MGLIEFLENAHKKESIEWSELNLNPEQAYNALVKTLLHFEPDYVVDNEKVIRNLALYIIRSKEFQGDLDKGILLCGPTGTGKTLILNSFKHLIQYFHRKGFAIYSGKQIEHLMKREDDDKDKLERSMKYSLFGFDDIGEEHDEVMVYGTRINVGLDVLTQRHIEQTRKGSLTFGTTNLDRDSLRKKYGARIDSRIDEMFNVIPLLGKDKRRPEWNER